MDTMKKYKMQKKLNKSYDDICETNFISRLLTLSFTRQIILTTNHTIIKVYFIYLKEML